MVRPAHFFLTLFFLSSPYHDVQIVYRIYLYDSCSNQLEKVTYVKVKVLDKKLPK